MLKHIYYYLVYIYAEVYVTFYYAAGASSTYLITLDYLHVHPKLYLRCIQALSPADAEPITDHH
jgi:hypothetical protein